MPFLHRGIALTVSSRPPRTILGKKASTALISTLMVALVGSSALGAGLLLATFEAQVPFVPCNPYFVAGNITLVSDLGARTPQVGAPVWVNWTFTNGSGGPNSWFTHSWLAGGKYQFDLPCGYTNGNTLTLNAHKLGNVNASAVNSTTVKVNRPGSFLDGLLKAPALAGFIWAKPVQGEAPLTVTLNQSRASGGSGVYSFAWHFDDGTHATTPNGSIVHTYIPVRWYNATYILNDSLGNFFQANVTIIKVVPPVSVVSFTPSLTALNNSQPEAFTTTVVNGAPNYQYALQSGTNINPTPVVSALTTNTQTIFYKGQGSSTTGSVANITVTDAAGKTATATTTVWVYNLSAHANLGLSYRPADAGQSVQLNGTAMGGGNYYAFAWRFGDGQTTPSHARNPSHAFNASGSFTVRFWANDSAHTCGLVCPSTTLLVTINPALGAVLTSNLSAVDVGQRVSFSGNTSVGGSLPYTFYLYTFADGSARFNTTSSGVSHQFTVAGNYPTSLRLGDSAGMTNRSATLGVQVNALPFVSCSVENTSTAVATNEAYVGEVLTFVSTVATGGTGPFQYDFVYGDGSTSGWQGGTTSTHAYLAAGTDNFIVEVKDSGAGYYQSTTCPVTVYSALTSTGLSGNRTAGEVSLAETLSSSWTNGVAWYHGNISFGDGSALVAFNGAPTTQTWTHTYTKVENLTVNVTISDEQGERLVQHLKVFVYPMLSVVISASLSAANNDPPLNVTYTATIHGGSYNYPSTSWVMGDGSTSALLAPPTETYWYAGHYNASLLVTDNASDRMAGFHFLSVWGQNYTVTWAAGWNLVALPGIQTNYDLWFLWQRAVLDGAAGSTTTVAIQNTAGGLPLNYTLTGGNEAYGNQAIGDARGIWVDLASGPLTLHLSAAATAGPLGAPTTLLAGWNNLGWVLSGATTASAIATLIPSGSTISIWTGTTYEDYIVGFDTPAGAYDFSVTNGEGFQVWVPSATSFTE